MSEALNAVKHRLKNRKNTMRYAVFFFVAIFVGLTLFVWSLGSNNEQQQLSCADDNVLLQEAANAITAKNIQAQKTSSDEVESRSNYREDVNCLVIVTKASIEIGDSEKARASLDLLQGRYAQPTELNPPLNDVVESYDELSGSVVFLERLVENSRQDKVLWSD